VTVTATDPATGEVVAHFHMDEHGGVTDLRPEHPLAAASLGLEAPEHAQTGAAVVTVAAEPPTETAAETARRGVEGHDYPNGMTLGALLVLARDLDDSGMATNATIKAWTREDGTVIRVAAVHT
jgi:hypothetical protein